MSRLIAFGLGALAMYYLDPQQGRHRRLALRDQLAQYRHSEADGLRDEARGPFEREEPSGVPASAHHLGR